MRKSRSLPEPAEEANNHISDSRFSYGLLRVAAAQICQSAGFKGAQNSALEAITDISVRYLKTIAKSASTSANAGGRTQANLPDIIAALEDLASILGFASASLVDSHSLYTSAVITDLMTFVSYTDEIPFAQPFPSRKSFSLGDKQGKLMEYRRDRRHFDRDNMRHVPNWLPALPVVVVAPEEEKERKWGSLNGGEEDDRGDSELAAVKRDGDKEIELSGKRKRMKDGLYCRNNNGIVALRGMGDRAKMKT